MEQGNEVVKFLRGELELTQRAFAEAAGLSSVYVCQLETGVFYIGREATLAIVDAFGSNLDELEITAEDILRGHFEPARPAA